MKVIYSSPPRIVSGRRRAVGPERRRPHIEHEHPYKAIIDTAQKRGCDAIQMARRTDGAGYQPFCSAAKRSRCLHTALSLSLFAVART